MYPILKARLLFKILGLALVIATVQGTSDPDDGQSDSSPNDDNNHEEPGKPLSPSEFLEAEKILLHQSVPDKNSIDPIELAGLFEGDIVLASDNGELKGEKNAITDRKARWPNGVIHYTISSRYDEDERLTIAKGMAEIERLTCIKFEPRLIEHDYIFIGHGKGGCSSLVGRAGGSQIVSLGKHCVYPGIVMHELNHVIGFYHEQNRHDRDEYITVHEGNIIEGKESNFRKLPRDDENSLGAKYDTSSLMHYGPYAFSKNRNNGKKTITPKVENDRMGQREGFTETDIFKINKLYGCNKQARDSTGSPGSTSTTTQKPNSENSSDNCVDNHKNCQSWANSDECEKNPNWMLVNCKKSCNQCSESCGDNNKHCEYWAANDECKKNPEYMHVHCAKACKRC